MSAACAWAAAPETGDTFVSASIADARTLIPIVASDTASAEVCGMIFNGLVKYDKDLTLTGDLAQSWEVQDDGLSIVFHLRKGVRWHDGAPFTARDVEFTYRTLIDPAVRTPYSGDFERVKELKVLDDYTVKITYKEPFAPGLASWGMAILPRHLLAGADLSTTPFARKPVGTGPYRFLSWGTQEKIVLKANDDYFEHRPYLDRVVYRVIPDDTTIFLELSTQNVDAAGLSPLQFSRQTDTPFFRQHYRKFRLPGFTYLYLAYNLRNPLFADVRVRQALNMAVDKQELISVALLGYGAPTTGPFIPNTWAYNPEVVPAAFDPAASRRLLADAGWKPGKDGILRKDGVPLEFTILTNQGNEERAKVAQIIQRRLKEVGVRVKINVVEWSVLLGEFIDKKRFDTVLLGWSLPREPDNYDIWHSSKTRQGEFNFISYANPDVDRLLEEARRTFDQPARQACYRKVHAILYDEQPYMFLYASEGLSALHMRFEGVAPAPAGIGYNFIDWWVPRRDQRYRLTIQ